MTDSELQGHTVQRYAWAFVIIAVVAFLVRRLRRGDPTLTAGGAE